MNNIMFLIYRLADNCSIK